MKKTLLLTLFAMTSIFGMAQEKTYTDKLTVSVNGESSTQDATVIVETLESGNINFKLNNFVLLDGEGGMMGVGNIQIDDLVLTDGSFSFQGDLLITEGNLEGVDTWIGPMLGPVPLDLKGKMTEEKLYVTIGIDMMESLGQIIDVQFGSDIEAGVQCIRLETTENATYDLSGRRIAPNTKGLYIQNGKKYIRK